MFPVSNSSQTIIDCFLEATHKLGISFNGTKCNLFSKESVWKIETQNENYIAEKLILATKQPKNMGDATNLWSRHRPVPSYLHLILKI
jgi:predicted flavoprotein YhiN